MYESFKAGKAVSMDVSSVASGLSPPFAGLCEALENITSRITHRIHIMTFSGENCYRHCKAFVDSVLLVSDQELVETMFFLHSRGLYVEPSGAAAFAALRHNKVPDVAGKRVVVVVTGGNVDAEELCNLKQNI